MKLRNKKTGEIKEWDYVCALTESNPGEIYDTDEYDSLAKLNENWEDYPPAKPYIKDEKIRKFVREWATLNEIIRARIQRMDGNDAWFKIYGQDEALCFWTIEIHASYSEIVSKDYKGNMAPITELCREEGE